MKKIGSFTLLLFLISFLTFFQSCKKDENPTNPSEESTSIPATTKYFNQSDYNSYFLGFSSDSTQLYFNKNVDTKFNLKTNDMVVFSEGNGLLRKITNIQTTDSQLVVSTVQGTLEEAIENGRIEYSGALSKNNVQKVEILADGVRYVDNLKKQNENDFDFQIENEVLYDVDGNLSTTNDQIRLNGSFTLNSDVFVIIDVKGFKLQYAKYGFETNNNENLSLDAIVQYNLSKELEIARVTFTPIWVQVGLLTVVIIPDLRIKIGITGYANAGVSTSVENEFHFEAGSEYNIGDGWQPYKTFTDNFNYNPPSLTANCGAKAYIKPELNMAVYGVLAGYAYGEAYGKIEADLLQTPWWKLFVGYNLGIGARAEILGHDLFDYSLDDLISEEKLIAQAGSNSTPPTVTTSVVSDITTNSATSGGNVTLQGSSTVTARGVCWSTSQNPTISDNKTYDGTGTGSFTSSLTGLSASTKYYIKAYATNQSGTSYGNQVSFTTSSSGGTILPPILSYPPDGATNVSISPTLSWNSSSGATSYSLQVSTNNSFTNLIYDQSGLSDTSKQISGLSNSTQYFWHVNATNGSQTSDWSDIWSFTTGNGGNLEDGLVAYYTFDGILDDSSGYNNMER